MIMTLLLTGLLAMAPSTQTATAKLPATPQGQKVSAFIAAFNAGERAFVAAHDTLFVPAFAAKITPEERAQRFTNWSKAFGALTVERVVEADASHIVIAVPQKNGRPATMAFVFEARLPFRISGLDVER